MTEPGKTWQNPSRKPDDCQKRE